MSVKQYTENELKRLDIIREMAGEGMVLLKNDGVLPLKPGKKVSVFGKGQIHFLTGGSGSGATSSNFTVTPAEALQAEGIELMPELLEAYSRYCEEQDAMIREARAHNIFRMKQSTEEMAVSDGLISRAAEFSDTAIFVISRMAGEGEDRKPEKGDYYLSDSEAEILSRVSRSFDKLIIILNIAGIIDMKWEDEINPSAIIISWLPGQVGASALADIIVGKVNPSGHLPDTISENLSDHPSTENFGSWVDGLEDYTGDENQVDYWGMIGNHYPVPKGETVQRPVGNRWFTEYQEGIYVGYRYFTTFGVKVRYPFGYGLSYTTFDIKASAPVFEENVLKIEVTVKNTGSVPGKQVVQIYCRPAWKNIERPERELVSFGKTPILMPGESCTLELTAPAKNLSCYSEEKAAWIMEAGDYEVFAGDSCLSAVSAGMFSTGEIITEQDLNHFPLNHSRELKLLSRRDPAGTAPKAPPLRFDGGEKMGEMKPLLSFEKPELAEAQYRLSDVAAGRVTLNEFMSQMDDMELLFLCIGTGMGGEPVETFGKRNPCIPGAGGHTAAIERLGIPSLVMSDGPAGIAADGKDNKIAFTTACVTSSSWNAELAERLGEAFGEEAVENRVNVWLAPAMNIHRNPLCGRNYEYFSEDPLLAGKMAAAIVRGAQKSRVSCCIKHFAVNNQETNRFDGVDSVASERTIREIYLKGFEIAVREAQPGCVMTSYNSLNGAYTATRRDLIENVLREEWGFEGFVVSDWEGDGPYAMEALQAGNDLLMPGFSGQHAYLLGKIKNGELKRETLEDCCRNILKAVIRYAEL